MADKFTTTKGRFTVTGEGRRVEVDVGGLLKITCERTTPNDRTTWMWSKLQYEYSDAGFYADLFGDQTGNRPIDVMSGLWSILEAHWSAWRETKGGRKERLRETEDRLAALEKRLEQ